MMVASLARRSIYHPGCHDGGNCAGEPGQQRNERLPGEPAGPEQSIHQERGAGHVAAVFQEKHQSKKENDLRQEDHNRADTGPEPVDQQAGQRSRRQAVQCIRAHLLEK